MNIHNKINEISPVKCTGRSPASSLQDVNSSPNVPLQPQNLDRPHTVHIHGSYLISQDDPMTEIDKIN